MEGKFTNFLIAVYRLSGVLYTLVLLANMEYGLDFGAIALIWIMSYAWLPVVVIDNLGLVF